MEKMGKTGILLTLLFTIGCDNNSGSPLFDNGGSPLLGIWQTESCKQVTTIWIKGIYEFTTQGTIRLGNKTYNDANCSQLSLYQEPGELPNPVIFQDKGQQLLQEGIEGGGLYIEMPIYNNTQSFDGFYTINNSVLCFSDAFTLEADIFAVMPGLVDIDFNNCLTRL